MNSRKMMPQDAGALNKLCEACGLSPWSEESFLGEVDNPVAQYIVLEEAGEILGFAGIWCVVDEAQVMNIGIAPQGQGRGLGKQLMKALMAEGRSHGCVVMTLEVKAGNTRAISLYEGLGFERNGLRKDYYPDHSDGILMIKSLLAEADTHE